MTDRLNDPIFRATQRVAAHGEGWVQVDVPPEGEVIWREDGGSVRLTPDGWLVYLNGGKGGLYAMRLRATPELVGAMRGGSGARLREACYTSDARNSAASSLAGYCAMEEHMKGTLLIPGLMMGLATAVMAEQSTTDSGELAGAQLVSTATCRELLDAMAAGSSRTDEQARLLNSWATFGYGYAYAKGISQDTAAAEILDPCFEDLSQPLVGTKG